MILRRDPEAAEAFYTAIDMDQGHQQLLAVELPSDHNGHSRSSSVSSAPELNHLTATSSTSLLPPSQSAHAFIGPRRLDDSSCDESCACTCHNTHLRRSSAPLLRTSLSPIDHKFGTVVFGKKCSAPDCRVSKRRRAQFTAAYPSNLFNRLVTVSLLFQGLKMSFRLHTPTFVPEYADVVRATLNGDLEWLKRIFSSKLGHPNDTSVDGWSLLHVSHVHWPHNHH